MNIKSVGVIGAGQMGTGIAHVAALHGYDVLLNDLTREKIDAGVAVNAAASPVVNERVADDCASPALVNATTRQ